MSKTTHGLSAARRTLNAALVLAAYGFRVFAAHYPIDRNGNGPKCSCGNPKCKSIGKHPVPEGWQDVATSDTDRIREQWAKRPCANIAIACGGPADVLDVDGEAGMASLAKLEANYGALPKTWRARTGGGGIHIFFQSREGLKNLVGFAPGLDMRSSGALVIGPGSVHASGNTYEWEPDYSPDDCELAPMPDCLFELIIEAGKKEAQAAPHVEGMIPEGKRNATLTSLAGSMRRRGMSEPAIVAALQVTNAEQCTHPLEASEVAAIAASVSHYEPATADFALTDWGNAERLIDAYGDILRFNVNADKWLLWNGKRWEYDTTEEIYRLAMKVIRALYRDLKDADSGRAKDLLSHIKKSESAPRLAAMVSLAAKLPGVPVKAIDLDHDFNLLNLLNGTLDTRTSTLRPHAQGDLITKLAPVEYDPSATAPRFKQFLGEVFQGDEEVIGFLQRWFGYCLTGDTSEQCFIVFIGKGSNGKSVLVELMRAVQGDYAGATPFNTLLETRDSSTSDLAGLMGMRFVTASEGEEAQSFNEPLLKTIVGGDPVKSRYLYQDFFEYTPTYKVLVSTNEVPRIKSQNYALKRRFKVVVFRERFYDVFDGKSPVKDTKLLPKLLEEKSGILAWAVEGCLEWRRIGLATPPVIRAEVERLFESQDLLAEWLDAECEICPGAETESGLLWKRYVAWCEGEGRKPAFKQTTGFSRSLLQRDGIERRNGSGGVRLLTGIRLLTGSESPDPEPDTRESDPFPKPPVEESGPLPEDGPGYECEACKKPVTLKGRPHGGYHYTCSNCQHNGVKTDHDYQPWLKREAQASETP